MNPLQIDPILTSIGIGFFLITNIGIWIFAYGRRTGSHNTKMSNIEKELDNPSILPECTKIFGEIRENLIQVSTEVRIMTKKVETNIEVRDKVMELSGKVEYMFLAMKEDQMNNEKKRISGTNRRRESRE